MPLVIPMPADAGSFSGWTPSWISVFSIADAVLDRLIHNAYKTNLKGGSLRKKYAGLTW